MAGKRRAVGGQTFVCLGYDEGVTPLVAPPATTSECEPHAPMPDGYVARSEWADQMMTTHTQRPCKGCGLCLIWEPIKEVSP
jgi:hypothetical protein